MEQIVTISIDLRTHILMGKFKLFNIRRYHIGCRGDDKGKVGLFKFPTTVKNAEFVEGNGHSSHVPCVKWSLDDEFLYSIGGED